MVSAAGWVDENALLMASAHGLWRVDLRDGTRTLISPLEQENDQIRSNDGRADPWGGFWIGTMGYNAEPGAGAIYRFYRNELRQLFGDITISNAICFAPDRTCAYFTDTATRKVMKVRLDPQGWPAAEPTVFIDLTADGLKPDGAVADADGTIWIAQWGASRVAAYDKSGTFLRAVSLPAAHVTCPAFGGDGYATLFVTSARQGLSEDALQEVPEHGMTFALEGVTTGQAEPQVLL
jgi:sugar lactone lactonase YvrE